MYSVTHMIIGAALGSRAPSVPSAAALGLFSHAVLDMIPHSDYDDVASGLADVGAVTASLLAARGAGLDARTLAGAVAAVLPDIEVGLRYLGLWPFRALFPTHSGQLPHGKTSTGKGILIQAGMVAGGLLVLALKGRPGADG